MSTRYLASTLVPAALALASLAAPGRAQQPGAQPAAKPAAKSGATPTKSYTPPKLPWGDPDLQGQWPAASAIPMQRPADLGDRAQLTDDELAKREAQAAQAAARDGEEFVAGDVSKDLTINPPGYWVEHGKPNKQASLVIDPPNGRIPELTAKGKADVQAQRGGLGPGSHFPDKVDSWEDFDYYSRCITRGFPSTMLYTIYNYGNDIIQSPGYVVIRSEMVHEQRIIPVDGRAHLGKAIKTYMGNSVGHWEGNTLVVETTNLRPESGSGGRYTDAAKVTERFTRIAPGELRYEATISDPNVWTRPYTIRYPFKLEPEYKLYEYACHEGNYMMLDSLSAARQLEAQGLETKVERGPAGGPLPGTR